MNTKEEEPITVVVRRRVKSGREAEFEAAMREFIGFALASPGHLAIHVIRPAGSEPAEARRVFRESPAYQAWMQRLKALTEGDPQIEEMGGLASWFTLPDRPHA